MSAENVVDNDGIEPIPAETPDVISNPNLSNEKDKEYKTDPSQPTTAPEKIMTTKSMVKFAESADKFYDKRSRDEASVAHNLVAARSAEALMLANSQAVLPTPPHGKNSEKVLFGSLGKRRGFLSLPEAVIGLPKTFTKDELAQSRISGCFVPAVMITYCLLDLPSCYIAPAILQKTAYPWTPLAYTEPIKNHIFVIVFSMITMTFYFRLVRNVPGKHRSRWCFTFNLCHSQSIFQRIQRLLRVIIILTIIPPPYSIACKYLPYHISQWDVAIHGKTANDVENIVINSWQLFKLCQGVYMSATIAITYCGIIRGLIQ